MLIVEIILHIKFTSENLQVSFYKFQVTGRRKMFGLKNKILQLKTLQLQYSGCCLM